MKSSTKKQKPYVSGNYDRIKNELPENLRKFCDIINKDFVSKNNPTTGDLQGVTYDAVGKKLKFPLDDYTTQGMNLLVRLIRRTAKLPEFSSILKFDREALLDGDAILKIKTEPTIKENKMKSNLQEVKQFQKIAGLLKENESGIEEDFGGAKKTIEMDLVPYTGDSQEDQKFWSFLESHNIILSILTWHGPGGGAPVVQLTGSEKDLRDLLESMGHDEDDIAMYMGEE